MEPEEFKSKDFVFGCILRRHNIHLEPLGKLAMLSNGYIGGAKHENETFWELRNGVLTFSNRSKSVTTAFTEKISIGGCEVLIGPCLVAPTTHFLYPLKTLGASPPKILFVVSSHVRYTRALECLLPQLKEAGVPPESTWVTVAGSDEEEMRLSEGIIFSQVQGNAFEYIGLIDVVRRQPSFDFVFLLHDTCHVGPRFLKFLKSQPWTFEVDYLSVMPGGFFNIGLYRMSWLMQIQEFLEGLMGISKEFAIEVERNETGKGFKSKAPVTSNFWDGFGQKTGIHYPYDPKVPREGVYLRGADIHKFFGSAVREFKP